MEKVLKDGKEVIEWEEVKFVYPSNPDEWARVDKDMNVTHLDMDLCAKGPQNVYTALAIAIWNKAIEHAADNFEVEDSHYYDAVRETILRWKK